MLASPAAEQSDCSQHTQEPTFRKDPSPARAWGRWTHGVLCHALLVSAHETFPFSPCPVVA